MSARQSPIPVLHIATAKSWRGGEQQLAYLLEETQKADEFEPYVLTFPETPFAQYCQAQNIPHFTLRKGFLGKLTNPFLLDQVVHQKGIALIHVHDAHGHTLAIKATVLAHLRKPVIVTRRVDFPIKSNWLSQYKYNHPVVKKIICISEAIRAITQQSVPDNEKLAVVHSGIDLERFQGKQPEGILRNEHQLPKEAYLIGNTSALADHKDYYTFVDTAEKLLNQGVNAFFFIIGSGPEYEAIRQYIDQKGLSDHILMTGFRKDIDKILPELDLYLMTSKTEGLGTSVLDAMACGVPIVATRAGGIPEMIVHEKNGLLSPVGDPESLAEQAMRVLQDEELRTQFVQKSREAVKKFDKAYMAQGNFRIYQEVLNHNP